MWNYVTVAGLLSWRKMIASINLKRLVMTPEQKRLLYPLTRQTSTQKAANLAAAVSLAWPFSILRTWLLAYHETFLSVLDPICLNEACGQETEKEMP